MKLIRAGVPRLIAAIALVPMMTVAAGVLANVGSAGASAKVTISVAYAADTTFDTIPLGVTWWGGIQKEFEAKYPNVTLKLIPVAGGEPDFLTKLALLYRSPATSPDVAQFPSTEIALYQSSDYLLPMTKLLKGSTWFSQYPTVIQNEGKIGGQIYAVSAGENNNGLYYDKAILQKAGIKLPWQPKTWADIITAAKAIKKAEPNVIPLWTDAGTSAGPNGAGYGILNLLAGSSTPTIQTSSNKMVVSSKGLLQTLNFYHEVFSDGLGAPTSQLFSPNNAPNIPSADFEKGTLGIAVAANFIGGNWTKQVSFPYWPQASTAMGVAGLPTINGPGYASTLSGWDFGISSHTKDAEADIDLINVMQESTNMINAANWAGWVPPVKSYWTIPLYDNFAKPFNEEFGNILPYSSELPATSNYSVWVEAIEQASGAIAQKPNTTGAQAMAQMKSYVSNQLGPSEVASLP
jgi:multiple sugar transport system substrate-binding protein